MFARSSSRHPLVGSSSRLLCMYAFMGLLDACKHAMTTVDRSSQAEESEMRLR